VNPPVIKDIDLDFALEQDQKDPLAHFRGRFHFPETKTGKPFIYFCGNSLGLQPDTADQYIKEELDAWKKLGVEFQDIWPIFYNLAGGEGDERG